MSLLAGRTSRLASLAAKNVQVKTIVPNRTVMKIALPYTIRKWMYDLSGFNQYGLYHNDIFIETEEVAEALRRLPKEVQVWQIILHIIAVFSLGFHEQIVLSFPLQPRKLSWLFYFVVYDPKSNLVRGRPCMEFMLKPKGIAWSQHPFFLTSEERGHGGGDKDRNWAI